MLKPSTSWRITFQSLRDDFKRAAEAYPRVRHAIVQAVDQEGSLPPRLEREMHEAGGWSVGEMRARWVVPTSNGTRAELAPTPSLEWARWRSPSKQGYLFGDAIGRKKFEYLAERGWLALPGSPDGKVEAYAQPRISERWLSFV